MPPQFQHVVPPFLLPCKLWHYDYCIIDNPPDIGLNVINALAITDEVIVPVKLDNYALEGLDIVAEQIEDVRGFNPAIRLAGVLITSYQNTDGGPNNVRNRVPTM